MSALIRTECLILTLAIVQSTFAHFFDCHFWIRKFMRFVRPLWMSICRLWTNSSIPKVIVANSVCHDKHEIFPSPNHSVEKFSPLHMDTFHIIRTMVSSLRAAIRLSYRLRVINIQMMWSYLVRLYLNVMRFRLEISHWLIEVLGCCSIFLINAIYPNECALL